MASTSSNRPTQCSTSPHPIKPWEKANEAAARKDLPVLNSSLGDTSIASDIVTNNSTVYTGCGLQSSVPAHNSSYYPMHSYGSNNAGYGNFGAGAGYNSYGVYGGYNGMGFGSYNSYGFGGGYGAMSRFGGGIMDPNGQLGWLNGINQIISSIGQITEMLGMNAEALHFCVGSFVHFIERVGGVFAGIASMLTPKPVFPPGHPRHGDPQTNEEEERSRLRRVRIFQCIISMAVLGIIYKGLKWRISLKAKRRHMITSSRSAMNKKLESIFQRTLQSTT